MLIKISSDVCLFAPDSYSTDKKCNGCGTGWSAALIPNTIYFLDIIDCCCIHDHCYEVGKTIEDKEAADRIFFNNMLRVVEGKEAWWFPHFLARARVMEYYTAVVNFGGTAFWEGKNK